MDNNEKNWIEEELNRLEGLMGDMDPSEKEYGYMLDRYEKLKHMQKDDYELELRIAQSNARIIHEDEEHILKMKREEQRMEKEQKRIKFDVSGDTIVKVCAYSILTGVCLLFETEHVIHFKNSWNMRNNIRV